MYLPYLNYTQPMSLCVLGIDKTIKPKVGGLGVEDSEYVALGQRALATFPFFAVYDRESGSAYCELGNANLRA